ncbi:hypothetical protein NDU88_005073 [Pleurodeles waltl]|uniref:Uncharacterized protein n=1 Tax=Pleurodeles waltl TaxID=8319 RepID=A0AAV7RN27_PLEWA|nr:hypothetical protein NDU88_005073 [Pleurodeles waltl]
MGRLKISSVVPTPNSTLDGYLQKVIGALRKEIVLAKRRLSWSSSLLYSPPSARASILASSSLQDLGNEEVVRHPMQAASLFVTSALNVNDGLPAMVCDSRNIVGESTLIVNPKSTIAKKKSVESLSRSEKQKVVAQKIDLNHAREEASGTCQSADVANEGLLSLQEVLLLNFRKMIYNAMHPILARLEQIESKIDRLMIAS